MMRYGINFSNRHKIIRLLDIFSSRYVAVRLTGGYCIDNSLDFSVLQVSIPGGPLNTVLQKSHLSSEKKHSSETYLSTLRATG